MARIDRLIEQLKSEDYKIKIDAALALGRMRCGDAVLVLSEALKNGDDDVRLDAASALEKIGKPAVPALIDALKDEKVRRHAAAVLGKIGDVAAVPALMDALKDEGLDVRIIVIMALRKIGAKDAVPALIDMLKDKRIIIKGEAAEALGEIGDASAVLALVDVLKDEDWTMRREATTALGKFVEKCGSVEELEAVEKGIVTCSAALRKEKDIDLRIDTQRKVAKLLSKIAKKKNELAPKRDLLLDDKPKSPKKGRRIYQAMRMIRNG